MFGFFKKKIKINTSHDDIESFLNRGVENIFPSKDFLRSSLKSGKRLTIYLGIDPTGPTLHLGHGIVLKKLRDFQKLGHQVILLIGDFTATIGDPTDKFATRKMLTRKDVLRNAKNYKKQASKFISFSGPNKALIKYNSKWFSKMSFEDVVGLSSKMTVQQMLERDMFEKRIEEGKPIHIHEFLYPLMQGYDSVVMKVDGEIGGNDQTFNMLAGRDLMKQILNKEKFVIATKLLEDSTGKKMGKTENNMVTMSDSPKEMFGKIMSWTDEMILPGFEICTDVSFSEIDRIKRQLENGDNPKGPKTKLAKEIVALYHSKKDAKEAEESFVKTFGSGEMPDDALEASVLPGENLLDILMANKIVSSKGEGKRLMDDGGISEISGQKIKDYNFSLTKDTDLKVGKKRFVKIKIKN